MTTLDIQLTSKSEWIEMFPFGIVMGANNVRPVMVFKDKSEKRVLPVWLSPMDAGIAVSQANTPYHSGARVEGSPHELSWKILSAINLELEKCLFREVKGHQQYLELHFRSTKNKRLPNGLRMIESPAEDAISFCMRSGCRFYATVDYIERSRVLEFTMAGVSGNQDIEVNPHPYLN